MRPEASFDFRNPDYRSVYVARAERLKTLRADPLLLAQMKLYYADHIAEFISDWGVTHDPRNVERNIPTAVPFLLFPKQIDWINWLIDHWRNQKQGITEKTRQMGFSWMTMAFSCAMCLFHDGFVIGVGSRKQDYVDVIGDPKSLIQKARLFMSSLPFEFRGGWESSKHSPHMRMVFPESKSIIVGESGDELGRGNSTAMYFVDESAFLEHPLTVDAALSQTTNCRQDISTPNGMANSFAQRRFSETVDVFTFHWRDDPRKDEEWYAKQVRELDPTVVAQEINMSYSASVEGVVIPAEWIQAAIGACTKLGIEPTGRKFAGLDVADEGVDKNAFAGRHGLQLEYLRSWSGKGGDIYKTVVRAFAICDEMEYEGFDYDADGLGAGVRGDARNINEERKKAGGLRQIKDAPFRGSGAVWKPEGEMVKKRKNKDYFANLKAQSYWALRLRFQATHRAVVEKMPYNVDDLISIDPKLPELNALIMELSQPTYEINGVGKILIDKAPEGTRSPNLSDAVMIAYQPAHRSMDIWSSL
jgi:phage terminase large subunit